MLETMEAALYVNAGKIKSMKANMSLDFSTNGKVKQEKLTSLLGSPDLQMLKLASPELENLIIAQNGMVTTTPTPTQFLCPKNVTQEQEEFSKGFVSALESLLQHGLPDEEDMDTGVTILSSTSKVVDQINSSSALNLHELMYTTSLPDIVHAATIATASPSYSAQFGNYSPRNASPSVGGGSVPRLLQLKEEPQTVPCMANTAPLSPINMEKQERIKLERKRARNRVAARKCRTRKLERISKLEERVSELKGQNTELTETANDLRKQVFKLKKHIVDHISGGCQMLS